MPIRSIEELNQYTAYIQNEIQQQRLKSPDLLNYLSEIQLYGQHLATLYASYKQLLINFLKEQKAFEGLDFDMDIYYYKLLIAHAMIIGDLDLLKWSVEYHSSLGIATESKAYTNQLASWVKSEIKNLDPVKSEMLKYYSNALINLMT